MKVCEKVREKGTTSYNEVADELVNEFTNSPLNSNLVDQVPRRRVNSVNALAICCFLLAVRPEKHKKASLRCFERSHGHEYHI